VDKLVSRNRTRFCPLFYVLYLGLNFLSIIKRVIIKMKIGIEEEEIGWLILK